jgi:DNA polymerase-3 subunit beta
MRFRTDRDVLADAVAWAARGLPVRPPVPVLAGLVIDVADVLALAGFDYEVSAQATTELETSENGRALVPGRLFADIVRGLPAGPVEVTGDSASVSVAVGGTTFTLPTLPLEDYPTLPPMPPPTAILDGVAFADAVAKVASAAGRDETLPMLTGARLELEAETLTLVCTDRYRIAVVRMPCRADGPATALVPARTLADAVKQLRGELTIALSDGVIGLAGDGRQMTVRPLDDRFIDHRAHFAAEPASRVKADTAALIEAVKRVSLVAERNAPIRLTFTTGRVTIETGAAGEARAVAVLGCVLEGDDVRTAFNPAFLLDALGAVRSATTRLDFTAAGKRAIVSDDTYRCVLMPVRLA